MTKINKKSMILIKKINDLKSTITETKKNHEKKIKLIRKNKNQLRNKMEKINDTILTIVYVFSRNLRIL